MPHSLIIINLKQLKKQKLLITGIGGFIGFHLAKKLIVNGYEIYGIDNLNTYYTPKLKKRRLLELGINTEELCYGRTIVGENLTFLYSDISDENTWTLLSDLNFSGVIHLAGQAGVRHSFDEPMVYIKSNILGFQCVIDFCVKQSISTFLYASSSSVYGKNSIEPFSETAACDEPESLYAATKRSNELIAHSYYKTKGLTSIGLRFFTVYGPWGRPDMLPMILASAALNKTTLDVYNQGNQLRDFTYIDDIVEGITRCLCLLLDQKILGSQILNIGRGAPQNLMIFINEFERQFGVNISKSFKDSQPGDVSSTYADISELKKISGYEPIVDYTVGLKNFISWIKEYYTEICVE